jgi:hypothetical protein
MRKAHAVERPQLRHLVRVLAAEAERGGPGGLGFVGAIATALALQRRIASRRSGSVSPSGQRRRVYSY